MSKKKKTAGPIVWDTLVAHWAGKPGLVSQHMVHSLYPTSNPKVGLGSAVCLHVMCSKTSAVDVRWQFWFNGPRFLFYLIYFFQLSATISVPWWQWFLTRFGKKTAINCSMIVSTKCWIVEMHVFMFIFYLLLFIYFVVSFPTVGNTVHDHNCVRQEQPHCFLFGLSGGGRECGSSFLSALVRRPY